MPRGRAASVLSAASASAQSANEQVRKHSVPLTQELSSMYDYLVKVVLIGPSGCGKSCLLHRFVRDEWRIYTSQTIGVEFASKIVKVGTGARRRRVKLQLWDTAGTERFRSVSRSYYRAAAAAILVYDVASLESFRSLGTFLSDARALGSRQLVVVLAGNKSDLFDGGKGGGGAGGAGSVAGSVGSTLGGTLAGTLPRQKPELASSLASRSDAPLAASAASSPSRTAPRTPRLGAVNTVTRLSPYDDYADREVAPDAAASWAEANRITTAVEVSALSGDGVDALFARLAATILTRIELGDIDPDDPGCGIQYGGGFWGDDDAAGAGAGSVSRPGTRQRGTVSLWAGGGGGGRSKCC